MRKLKLLIAILVLSMPLSLWAQVTTGNISGTIKTDKNQTLNGATIVLTHEPTGAKFTVTSKGGGHFDVSNIPPGGPYSLVVTYVGYGEFRKNDINLPLGEKIDIDVLLSTDAQTLGDVVVTGRREASANSGTSTNIGRRQVLTTPNIARNLSGLTKLSPQANGNSFAGMNWRYNNITIDGSLFNNNFGRSGDGFVPGGAISAISVDAIDQVQVNLSPFDVRQSGFIGGGVNAVTRRGTNEWYGTAYTFYRNQNFTGSKVNGQEVANANRSTKTFGGSIGGPIIRNKLFFFVNAEREERTNPGQTWKAKRPGVNDNETNVSNVLASDLDRLKQFLISEYKFDPGIYEGYNFEIKNTKMLARLDWNISNKHRVSFRYTYSNTDDDDQINASSVTGLLGSRPGGSRRSGSSGVNNGLPFNGSNFKNNTKVKSAVLEYNANFASNVSNQLLASYTDNQPRREPNSNFPFVDILSGSNYYISFGTDLFSYKNFIVDKALNIADNVTVSLGKHTLTAGASFERMSFQNSFSSAGGPSYYRYASVDAFINKQAPITFGVTFDPLNPKEIRPAEAKFAQLGVYVQDVWTINRLKLTYGLRVDQPFYPFNPPRNIPLESVIFKNEEDRSVIYDVSKWPMAIPLFSPRVGFTYDVKGDKSTIVRGGTGIFTGRIPFIYLVNQVGDNGVNRASRNLSGTDLAAVRFNPDRTTYIPATGSLPTTIPSGSSFTATARDFRMPQVWRSSLAVDHKFGNGFTATLEGLYTKTFNNVYFRNDNLGAQNGTLGGAVDKRPIYNTTLNTGMNQMIVMDNTNKGRSLVLTAQLQKSFAKGWDAGVAYTFTDARDVSIGTSDQSGSAFGTNNIAGNPNDPELGYSNFSIPHRVMANASYKLEYGKGKMSTTFGLIYVGASQDRISYRYATDINGDGQSNDMVYVPKNASEIQFVEGFKVGNNTYTAQQQSDAFFAFVENDKYLSKNKGKYMYRYGALLPWVHNLDLRVLQDFSVKAGKQKHTLQVSVDVVNFLNLLNSNWGYRYGYNYGTFQDQQLLGLASSSNNTGSESFNRANPKYTFDPNGAKKVYQPDYSTFSTWGLQLGVRYIFN